MWDNVETTSTPLSHDRPCLDCGHATHSYLPCSDSCDCVPSWLATTSLTAVALVPSMAA
jgi:hypothetical protein